MRIKPILINQVGAMVMVKYPYRKSTDLYVAVKDHPVFCAQCDAKFDLDEFVNHIRSHDRRQGKAQLLNYEDGHWYEVKGFSHEKPEEVKVD